jgi:uncharacterized pyridoxamine 5'-phosphate oxidase family protein
LGLLIAGSLSGAFGGGNQAENGMEQYQPLTGAVWESSTGILARYPNGVLAFAETAGPVSKLRLRTSIVTFQFAEENRIYFCTNRKKSLYQCLKKNPAVSYCTNADEFEPVLSFNGTVVFVEDLALKTRLMERNPRLRQFYQTPDNPVFTVFYIEVDNIETFDRNGAVIYRRGL